MPELFIELLSEEIPARMQVVAEERLRDGLAKAIKDAGLGGDAVKSWSGPRRLAVSIDNVLAIQPDLVEERRGPRADAPAQAIEGFLKGAGVSRDAVEARSTPKGVFLFAVINKKGGAAEDVIPQLLTDILNNFAWPKSMRWGRTRQRWVRPLHRISVLFDGKGVKGAFDLGGGASIKFGTSTLGHRIVSPAEITLTSGKTYEEKLLEHSVVVSRDQRIKMIKNAITKLTNDEGFIPGISKGVDIGLVAEVAGLVEYPHAIMGEIDAEFTELPSNILTTVMHNHQKYFAVLNKDKKLAPHFITISNMPADKKRDDMIRHGNERVLKARFADAQFFWDHDKATPFADNIERLKDMVFFGKLGTVYDKAKRLEVLAGEIARQIGADEKAAATAGFLAKADLVSGTVGEFPELQGIIGGHLARYFDHGDGIANAIALHYRPEGPNDYVPPIKEPLAIAVALADKLDTLVGFFHLGEVPTGSKDPFALRRATLGVVRIIVENELDLNLEDLLKYSAAGYGFEEVPDTLMPFILDRFKGWLRDQGFRYDIVNAVIYENNVYRGIFFRSKCLVKAIDELLATEDGEAFMIGYKRAINILDAEKFQDEIYFVDEVKIELFATSYEKELYRCVDLIDKEITSPLIGDAFENQMTPTNEMIALLNSLTSLRVPIDAFFENVTINDDDAKIRLNRLNLLAKIKEVTLAFGNFSKIEG
ncbi:MAG: glycine--tRNA ligase subunit beta [Candidatus Puniceispirillales bacterium WSBS_2018_MAG_OTU23]